MILKGFKGPLKLFQGLKRDKERPFAGAALRAKLLRVLSACSERLRLPWPGGALRVPWPGAWAALLCIWSLRRSAMKFLDFWMIFGGFGWFCKEPLGSSVHVAWTVGGQGPLQSSHECDERGYQGGSAAS